jgi:hypothetical protein
MFDSCMYVHVYIFVYRDDAYILLFNLYMRIYVSTREAAGVG